MGDKSEFEQIRQNYNDMWYLLIAWTIFGIFALIGLLGGSVSVNGSTVQSSLRGVATSVATNGAIAAPAPQPNSGVPMCLDPNTGAYTSSACQGIYGRKP